MDLNRQPRFSVYLLVKKKTNLSFSKKKRGFKTVTSNFSLELPLFYANEFFFICFVHQLLLLF